MPVGNPYPISKPAGAIRIVHTAARTTKLALSNDSRMPESHIVTLIKYATVAIDQSTIRPGLFSVKNSEIMLPMPVNKIMENNTMLSE